MSALKAWQNGLAVFLHFYTSKVCIRKNITFYPGERRRFFLDAERLQTAFPIMIILEWDTKLWKLNGKKIYEENFCTLRTKAGEEITVVISRRGKRLMPCKKLSISGEREIRAGKDFRNEIFYDCFSSVRDRHMRIFETEEGSVIEIDSSGEARREAKVYVNGAVVSGRLLLKPGDLIELMGMDIVYLPGIAAITVYYGILRTAESREKLPVMTPQETGRIGMQTKKIEQGVVSEKEILTEEVEIYLPEREKVHNSQPLILTLGPSVTMVIPVLLMAMLGSAMLGQNGAGFYRISVVMTAASAFLSLLWGIVNHIYKRRTWRKEESKRKEAYREYLNRTEQYLAECCQYNQQVLRERYPSGQSFLAASSDKGQVFWNRSIRQKDYLFIRMGLGDIPCQIRISLSGADRGIVRDLLTQEARDVADRYQLLRSVPVGIDLRKHRVAGFAGSMIAPVFLQVLLQLAVCHDGRDLKLIYFYHEEIAEEKKIADCIRWLPHIWKNGKRVRYLAGNDKEAGEILPELMKELEDRKEKDEKNPVSYIFLLAAKELIRGEGLYGFLTGIQENRGIYALFLDKERERLPGECECLIIREKDREEIIYYGKDTLKRQKVTLEESFAYDTEKFMRRLSGLTLKESGQEELLEKVSFLNLYGCEKVEDLNCQGRWMENRTENRIRVPIGMGTGRRIIYLDIHERFHGPHGLIAGTTGSGKSELLQTYLLSLAVSFGPEDINFFIIDYKGGGMGNTLCRLPHCAGVISNLSGRQIKRALSSIKSENQRRQQLLYTAGVNHVTDYAGLYREGKVSEPMPHLMLVVDEFAELKKEEPEFIQEIISVAQVGRSLGVHLLLSTQKPAGTVDDKIWSNTRFRLCLRVADKQDSADMLHRFDAAYLTGAGQCYLQVGNNEVYELFQAGYGGTEYEEEPSSKGRCCMVSNTGKRYFGRESKKEKSGTQMEAVINYVNSAAGQLRGYKAKTLWMQELSERLTLKDVTGEMMHTSEEMKLCIGMCDDPERQQQYAVYYHPLKDGNLCLCGAPATGKSTFLQTILWQLCHYPTKQVQFMLAGSDNAGVNCFAAMPGCLGRMNKKEDAECFFFHVERLLTERKEEMQGINFGQYRRRKQDAAAFLFLIIDNYGGFRQITEDRYEQLIEKIAGEGLNYGFFLITTALNVGTGELPGKLFEKIKTALSLEMSDKFQYADVLRQYRLNVFPKENVRGRGLCKMDGRALEFQIPLFSPGEDDYCRIDQVALLAEELSKKIPQERTEGKFPYVPDEPKFQIMHTAFLKEKENTSFIPLGYEERNGSIAKLCVKDGFSFLITGGDGTGKRNLLCCMMQALWEKEIETVLFDRRQILSVKIKKAAELTGKEQFFNLISDEAEFVKWYRQRNEEKKNCLCLSDLFDFSGMFQTRKEEMSSIRDELEQKEENGSIMPVIALCRPGREMELTGTFVYDFLVRRQCGIHFGGNAANQRMLIFDDISYVQMNQWEKPGTGYLKTGAGTKTKRIRVPLYDEEGEN